MSAQDDKEKDPLIGTTFANRYAIHGKLGKGGMAVVYRATDTQMGRDVAVKVLRTDVADEIAAKRLIREAKGAGALNHPNIITIFDRGVADDRVYIAMEILQGKEMSALMEEEGAIPVERALKICEQVASALAVAHGEGIIHRDIKPENLFLLSRGGGDIVKMLDFSIAKLPKEMVTQQLTRAGSVFGTPHYMAPEQVEGKQAVPQTDLYALGAVLYELITGDPPFDGSSVIDILLKHVKAPAPTLARPGLELPAGLSELVAQLLAKKPADRPESAEKVRELLSDMLRDVRRGAPKPAAAASPAAAAPAVAAPLRTPTGPSPIPGHTAPGHTAPGHTAPGHAAPGHAAPGHGPQGHGPQGHVVPPRMPTAAQPRVTNPANPAQASAPARQASGPHPRAPDPLHLPVAGPPAANPDDEKTIVGVGMSEKLNEMVRQQRAAQAAQAGQAAGSRPPPPPPHAPPPPASDDDEAKTMAVSKETLQAVQAANAARRPHTMVPSHAAREATGQTFAAQAGRGVNRETIDDRGPEGAVVRDTLTGMPPIKAQGAGDGSKLWLVGIAIAAGLLGAAFAYWLIHR